MATIGNKIDEGINFASDLFTKLVTLNPNADENTTLEEQKQYLQSVGGNPISALPEILMNAFTSNEKAAPVSPAVIEQQLKNTFDVQSIMPTPENPVVKALQLDTAVAAQTAASLNRETVSGTIGDRTATTVLPTTTSPEVMSSAASHMLTSFETAFPNDKFTVTEKDGVVTVEKIGTKTSDVVAKVPVGYNADRAATGLADMQTQLARETDPRKQLELAYSLKAAVATQSAAKYSQYVAQANAEAGVDLLVSAVADSRQLDTLSPTVRASGMMSKQTNELLQQLSQARLHSNLRVKQLMESDPVLGAADAIATLTIQKLDKQAIQDQRLDLNDERTRKQADRAAGVNDLLSNPTLLNRVSLLKTGQPATEAGKTSLANQIYDRKILLDPTEQLLAQMPAEKLTQFYLDAPDAKTKERTLQIMLYEEANALRGKAGTQTEGAVALQRIRDFRELMNVPMNDPRMPADIKQKWNADMLTVKTSMTGANKTKAETEVTNQAHLAYVDAYVKQKEQNDVRSWMGVIQADTTAKAIMQQSADNAPGKALPMREFITNYLNYNDGKTKADKITTLRTLVASHVEAIPNSVIFPKPSVSSFLSEVDRLTAATLLRERLGAAIHDVLNTIPGTGVFVNINKPRGVQ